MTTATLFAKAALYGELLLSATGALAADVTVTGGFVDFQGLVLAPQSGISAFINSQLLCPPAGCTATGAPSTFIVDYHFPTPQASVDFYTRPVFPPRDDTHNLVSFAPAPPQDVQVGSLFRVGTFTFFNGIWSGSADIGLRLVTHSSDPALDGHVMDAVIRMDLTDNLATNTPAQNADTFSLLYGGATIAVAAVYELADSPVHSNGGTVSFIGKIGSLLPVGFSDPGGGLFIASGDVAPVPEPETVALFAAGLGVGGFLLRSRRERRSRREGAEPLLA